MEENETSKRLKILWL